MCETRILTNEEVCRRKCIDCGYDGCELAQDSCTMCGERYTPYEDGNFEECPACGCDDYDTHCPECDSVNILYYEDYLAEKEMWDEGLESK